MAAAFFQHQPQPSPPQEHRHLPTRPPRRSPSVSPRTKTPRSTSQDPTLTFSRLLSNGLLSPNRLGFPSIFRACRQLSHIRQLHAQAMKRGFAPDANVQISLLRMYANFLACYDALKVLEVCSVRDVVSQNYLVLGFCRIGDLDAARKVFDEMTERNVVSWSIMLDGYARKGQMEIAQQLFDEMPERNQFSWSSLMSGYLRCGRVEVAQRIFDGKRSEWNVVTWTTMVSGLVQNQRFKEALDLFMDMQKSSLKPNKITLLSILPAIAHLGALTQGQWIHAYLDRTGVEVDSALGSALLDMYCKCGCIEEALNVFENLHLKELSAWNSIILGLAAHGRGKDALDIFSRLQQDAMLIPNEITFLGLLSACSHAGLVSEGQAIFDLFTNSYKLAPNLRHYGCMIDILARAGHLKEALEFLGKMPIKPNAVIWKTLLSACRIHKNFEMANRIWRKAIELGPQDSGFYVLVANMFNDVGRIDDASRMRREMNDQQVGKLAGCSWMEVNGVVHEFMVGRELCHHQGREIMRVLNEMEELMSLEYDARNL